MSSTEGKRRGKASNRRRRPFQYLVSYSHLEGEGCTSVSINRSRIDTRTMKWLIDYLKSLTGYDKVVIVNIIKM